jgi:hypothetical protein
LWHFFPNWKNIQIRDTYSTNKFIAQPAASISPGQKVQGKKVSHCGVFPNWRNIQIHDTYSSNKFIPQPAATISQGQKVQGQKVSHCGNFSKLEKYPDT